MERMIEIESYTLGEVFTAQNPTLVEFIKNPTSFKERWADAQFTEDTILSSDEVNEVWNRIMMRCFYSYVLTTERIGEDEDKEGIFLGWVVKAAQWLKTTYPRYKPVLDAYKKQTDLLKGIESKVGFSDMPESSDFNLSPSDTTDKLSSLTQSLSDGTTPIDRIKEISDKVESAYERWAEEFYETFCFEEERE